MAGVCYLTPAQLAARWSISVGTLSNYRSAGVGPDYIKRGRHVVYALAVIEAYEATWERHETVSRP